MGGFLGEIDEFLIDNPAHAMQRAVHQADVAEFSRLQHGPDERLVDDGGRAATLGDEDFSLQHSFLLR